MVSSSVVAVLTDVATPEAWERGLRRTYARLSAAWRLARATQPIRPLDGLVWYATNAAAVPATGGGYRARLIEIKGHRHFGEGEGRITQVTGGSPFSSAFNARLSPTTPNFDAQ